MQRPRLQSVDALRGFVMIIMALDHVRDFNHNLAASVDPEDLTKTAAALFFTRWITHICAPVFMFTAGVGAFWWRERNNGSPGGLAAFLVKRGLWLILLELTLFRFVVNFDFLHGPVLLVVLWALGASMLALAVMVRLPVWGIAALSLGMIALHNLLDGFRNLGGLWNILHQQGAFPLGPVTVVAAYPLIPWIGVMGAGYVFGRLMKTKSPQWILRLGVALVLAFVALRALNLYGDPVAWNGTLLSFLRCTKYPPSLAFLLMTLGPALILLGWFGRLDFSPRNPLIVFGRTPLFYFIVHLYLAHLVGLTHQGLGLGGTYCIWIAIVAAMYPLCAWFMAVKEKRTAWWLAYL
jgi:uncharacterized membrane protein